MDVSRGLVGRGKSSVPLSLVPCCLPKLQFYIYLLKSTAQQLVITIELPIYCAPTSCQELHHQSFPYLNCPIWLSKPSWKGVVYSVPQLRKLSLIRLRSGSIWSADDRGRGQAGIAPSHLRFDVNNREKGACVRWLGNPKHRSSHGYYSYCTSWCSHCLRRWQWIHC